MSVVGTPPGPWFGTTYKARVEFMFALLLLTTLANFLWSPLPLAVDDETQFITIFDGKSLDGWDGQSEHWRVSDGAIVGEIPAGKPLAHNTWLVWNQGELDDFELRLQFRLAGHTSANSGIQFRSQVQSTTHVSGYQADIDLGQTWLGRIYDEHGRALLVDRGTRVRINSDGKRTSQRFAAADSYQNLFRTGDWNDYQIKACGEHMTIVINGRLVGELIDMQTGQRDLSGRLALQLHSGKETKVRFRNIRYRKLKPGEHRVTFNNEK